MAVEPPPRRKFRPAIGADKRAFELEVKARLKNLVESLQAQHPEYKKFRVLPPDVRIKSPGSHVVLVAIIGEILSPQGATDTQVAIRSRVQKWHPNQAVYKDWTRPLGPAALAATKAKIQEMAPLFSKITTAQGLTLSSLHKQAKAAHIEHEGLARKYVASVDVTTDSVFINGEKFSITNAGASKQVQGRAKSYTYQIVRLRVDRLEEILQKGR